MSKQASGPIYPLSALRALTLHCQRLSAPNAISSTLSPGSANASSALNPSAIVELVSALGYVQIDTLQVVNRAHYVTLWARFGAYDTAELDRLIYTAGQRQLYEGWGHAASLIPLAHYRYHQWRTDGRISYNPGFRDWLSKPDNRVLVEQTLSRIRLEGSLRVGDFEHDGPQPGEWYDWKPSKIALEALFAHGELMVAGRVNFQRLYDVRERVLPAWVDTTPVDPDEARCFCLEQAARALGVFEARHLTFYAYLRATPARLLIKSLIDDGRLVRIQGESTSGVRTWLVHRDNLPLLQRAADGELPAQRTTFLTPFDSLFWAGERDQRLWGFDQVLECYKPSGQRVYGYFSFPILYKDRLVGRFDPQLERKSRLLTLHSLFLEPGREPDDELVEAVAAALRDFLAWHGAKDLRIEKSEPAAFGEKLRRVL